MADKTAIQWTDSTWNPTAGCSIVSPGCTNCYAMKTAHSLERRFGSKKYGALTKVVNGNPVWAGEVRLDEDALLQPLKWKRPRRIFVNSMSDLFHEKLTDEQIDRVFAVMALCPQHTFQVLTKRAERMRNYCSNLSQRAVEIAQRAVWLGIWDDPDIAASDTVTALDLGYLPNVWLGVSCERQQEADERIPLLLQTPAAVRFISAEPLLGPIDLKRIGIPSIKYETGTHYLDALRGGFWSARPFYRPAQPDEPQEFFTNHSDIGRLDWVIVGGESGPHARPMHPDWARMLRDQCAAAEVAYFFKQWGNHVHATQCNLNAEDPWTEVWLDDNTVVARVGKKAAGRLLDGREHNEFPSSAT